MKEMDHIFFTRFNRIVLFERSSSLERNEHLRQSLMDVNKCRLVLYNMPSSHTVVPPLRPDSFLRLHTEWIFQLKNEVKVPVCHVKWDII